MSTTLHEIVRDQLAAEKKIPTQAQATITGVINSLTNEELLQHISWVLESNGIQFFAGTRL